MLGGASISGELQFGMTTYGEVIEYFGALADGAYALNKELCLLGFLGSLLCRRSLLGFLGSLLCRRSLGSLLYARQHTVGERACTTTSLVSAVHCFPCTVHTRVSAH